jgi:predicted amidohydrolase YtcJ
MDIIFYNGKINTLDETGSIYSAVGVTGGRITAVGSDDELRRFSSPETESIDLKGAAMFPGFMEKPTIICPYMDTYWIVWICQPRR